MRVLNDEVEDKIVNLNRVIKEKESQIHKLEGDLIESEYNYQKAMENSK